MKTLGVITARGGSLRMPNKNILPLSGKPLVIYTVEAAKRSRELDKIVCSTDSERIISIVKKAGVKSIKRPAVLAGPRSPIEEALRHVLVTLRDKEGYVPDFTVLLYGNVPFRQKGMIDHAVKTLKKKRTLDAVVSISQVDRYHPERLALVSADGKFKPYLNKLSGYRSQELPKVYFIDSGVIAFKTRLLFGKDPLVISHYFKGYSVGALAYDNLAAWDIDNKFDWEIGELLLKKRNNAGIII